MALGVSKYRFGRRRGRDSGSRSSQEATTRSREEMVEGAISARHKRRFRSQRGGGGRQRVLKARR